MDRVLAREVTKRGMNTTSAASYNTAESASAFILKTVQAKTVSSLFEILVALETEKRLFRVERRSIAQTFSRILQEVLDHKTSPVGSARSIHFLHQSFHDLMPEMADTDWMRRLAELDDELSIFNLEFEDFDTGEDSEPTLLQAS
jgi:hypothetical protein